MSDKFASSGGCYAERVRLFIVLVAVVIAGALAVACSRPDAIQPPRCVDGTLPGCGGVSEGGARGDASDEVDADASEPSPSFIDANDVRDAADADG